MRFYYIYTRRQYSKLSILKYFVEVIFQLFLASLLCISPFSLVSAQQELDTSLSHTAYCINPKNPSTSKFIPSKTKVEGLLIYKIALSASPEFSAVHGNNINDVLAAIQGYIDQVNFVFEREIGIHLELADQSEKIIFLDGQPNPFSSQISLAVQQNIAILNDSIGVDNYDIGHLLFFGGGGLAQIQGACGSNKAVAASGFDEAANFFKLLAHEIGHQIGASHTWNSCTTTLNEIQRSATAAMEPGSGTTLMSYAGLCGANNASISRDPYFHAVSIEQIISYTRQGQGSTCPEIIPSSNTSPLITATTSSTKSLPVETPFILSGSGSDLEGDILTYAWDQIDQDDPANLGEETVFNPIIRSRIPSTSTKRYIPELTALANGTSDQSELLPSSQRKLEFRQIIRDNNPSNGLAATTDLFISTDTSAGPFVVNDLNASEKWIAEGIFPVNWKVANTDNANVDCQLVDILIDYDGLLRFDDTLALEVPNDGLHYISIPDTVATNTRIMVKASDHIFFDISDTPFEIIRDQNPDFLLYMDSTSVDICTLDTYSFKIKTLNRNEFQNPIRLSTPDVPKGFIVSFSKNDLIPGDSTVVNIEFESGVLRQTQDLTINAFAANGTNQFITYRLNIIDNTLPSPQLLSPESGFLSSASSQAFSWIGLKGSLSTLELSLTPNFEIGDIVFSESTSLSTLDVPLISGSSYFWRIKTENGCSEAVYSEIRTLGIKSTNCIQENTNNISLPIPLIRDSIISTIDIQEDLIIQSIQLEQVIGTHDYIGDLTFVLIDPNENQYVLVDQECNESKNFNFGISQDGNRLRCNIDKGTTYQSETNLSALHGTSTLGQWQLKIIDNFAGDGGELTNWRLKLCSYDNLANPEKIAFDTLQLSPSNQATLGSQIIDFEDQDNLDVEVTYIITSNVTHGYIINGLDTLRNGDSFSQADIDNNLISYSHANEIEQNDSFSFVVTDGEGYISSSMDLQIIIRNSVSIPSIEDVFEIKIYPNPIEGTLFIEQQRETHQNLAISIHNIAGVQVLQRSLSKFQAIQPISLDHLPPGIYILHISSTNLDGAKKIIVL